jgi:predicted O-methyltransferase YrrM
MNVSLPELQSIHLEPYDIYLAWAEVGYTKCLTKEAGNEHYRLLAHISKQLAPDSIVLDIGACYGASALALAVNDKVTVYSYDLTMKLSENPKDKTIKDISNIKFFVKNSLEDKELIQQATMIFLDVDPHDGIQEVEILQKFREYGFRGFVILDDIHLNPAMEKMWQNIPERKEDITKYGHYSGTGIAYFSDDIKINFV